MTDPKKAEIATGHRNYLEKYEYLRYLISYLNESTSVKGKTLEGSQHILFLCIKLNKACMDNLNYIGLYAKNKRSPEITHALK